MPGWLRITLVVLATLVIVIAIVTAIATRMFNQNAVKQVNQLFSDCPKSNNEIIRKEDLAGLPLPVQKWLERSHIIGKEKIASVRLKQRGLMRTKKGGPWMRAQAVQYFRADEPGFVWQADVQMAPLLHLSGLDNYQEGKGKMSIKLLSLFPVVNAKGPEMDVSTLLRYLAEMPWFPTAALNSYIKWEPINDTSARATMSYRGISASGVFAFSEQGDLISFTAKRYKEVNGKYVLSDWGGVNKEFKEFNGIRIPSKSDIIWIEKTGNFNWYQCEITDIEYNIPELF
ncbi:DUF6544 family protein [Paenibacillus durus]|uniref:Uncharacterized protein n=1 Tax=Paenibacillus durus TaxID=44251 RepID=A0A089HV85_PAEDU|nr:DUF6544 family protein [Paenibacillus durus]AIQ14992.1 hypothetical protein PDUR_26290 [Paenibacillus durus]